LRYICLEDNLLAIGTFEITERKEKCRRKNIRENRSRNLPLRLGNPSPRRLNLQLLIRKRLNHHSHGHLGNGALKGISITALGKTTMVISHFPFTIPNIINHFLYDQLLANSLHQMNGNTKPPSQQKSPPRSPAAKKLPAHFSVTTNALA